MNRTCNARHLSQISQPRLGHRRQSGPTLHLCQGPHDQAMTCSGNDVHFGSACPNKHQNRKNKILTKIEHRGLKKAFCSINLSTGHWSSRKYLLKT